MTTRLLLIRHGLPENYRDGIADRMSGWADFPLSQIGQSQVKLLANHWRTRQMSIAALYASPLRRAASTAQALEPFASRPIEFMDDLKEINCGDLDGLPIAEVKTMHRDVWQQNLRQDDEAFRWPGGESYREFRDRCLASIERISSSHQGERVAVVTHAGVISQVVGFLYGLSAACWEPFRPGIASVSELEWSSAVGKIIAFGDQTHLDKPEAGAAS